MDKNRIAQAHTPLSPTLMFRQFTGREEISRPFDWQLELLAEKNANIEPDALLGKDITIELKTQSGAPRFFNGQVTRFAFVGREVARESEIWRYEARLRPWLWYLTRESDFKIFQNKTVPEILDEVFAKYPYPVEKKLGGGHYRTWEYCVQYQETDFNFVSRLMEHEGIYYYFKHEMGRHTLVLANDLSKHVPCPGYDSVPYIPPDRAAIADEEYIGSWQIAKEVDSGTFITDDFDFKKPRAELLRPRMKPYSHPHGDHPIYEWPGGYVEVADGENYAKLRLEELQAPHESVTGEGNARGLAPGYLFTLKTCPRKDQNREYLILGMQYFVRDNPYHSGGEGHSDWRLLLTAQPTTVPYRPPRVTPKPLTNGPQTAVVVGKQDDEIYTDKYGRVKVQFHWDQYGQADENSSCWIRVSSPWAGNKWGVIFIPRVGQEVIVDFIAGDPDCPIITGRVYNAEHMPPYELDKYKEYSAIKTHSTKHGGETNWNELRFYDYKGKEQVFIHANWRMDVRVKWNKYLTVKESRHTWIHHSDMLSIGGKHQVYVYNDFGHRVDGKYQVSAGGVFQTTAESDYQLSSDTKVEVNAPTILVEAANSLTLKVGANIVKIDMSGITIQGMMVKINSGGGAGPASPFEFDDPYGAEEADTGQPGYLDQPKKKGGGGWKKKRKGGGHRAPITGLGAAIDGVAGRSPKLAGNLAQLQKDGWTIKYGVPGKGTFADRTKKEIVVDPNGKDDANGVVQSLAHESGHALYTVDPYVPPGGLSKEDYVKKNVNRNLKDEGEATMTNAEVRNEILNTDGGPDVGIAGSKAGKYDEIAKKYPDPKDREKARQEIGDVFAQGETPTGEQNAGKTYSQYYGETYEKEYDKQAAVK